MLFKLKRRTFCGAQSFTFASPEHSFIVDIRHVYRGMGTVNIFASVEDPATFVDYTKMALCTQFCEIVGNRGTF